MTGPRFFTISASISRGDPEPARRGLGFLLIVGVFALGLWQNLAALNTSQFHPDESRWLNRAYYLREIFHPTSKVWEDRYLTRGQPPVGSYLTGLGLLFQGRDLTTNGAWDFHYGNESNITWNAVKGNMPDPADIEAARRTNAVIGALSCVALFLIVARLTNQIGGLVAGIFLAFHPLQNYLASIGVSDAVFTFFFALAVVAGIALAKSPTWRRTVALGFVLGCGAATKLSPLFVSLPLAALGVAILVDPILCGVPGAGHIWSQLSRVEVGAHRRLGWMLISIPAITAATFVLSYPYLWPDPIGRTLEMFDFRRSEMDNQAKIWPSSAIDSRIDALRRTWHTLEDVYSSSGRGITWIGSTFGLHWERRGVDLPFALLGLLLLLWLAWKHGIASPHMLAIAILGGQSAVILTGLRVDFNRYYLPFVLTSGVGIGVLTGYVWTTVASLAGRSQPTAARRVAKATPRMKPLPGTTARGSRIADR